MSVLFFLLHPLIWCFFHRYLVTSASVPERKGSRGEPHGKLTAYNLKRKRARGGRGSGRGAACRWHAFGADRSGAETSGLRNSECVPSPKKGARTQVRKGPGIRPRARSLPVKRKYETPCRKGPGIRPRARSLPVKRSMNNRSKRV